MKLEQELLLQKYPDFAKLLSFGFVKEEDSFVYRTSIGEGAFDVRIMINDKGVMDAHVTDAETEEEYVQIRLPGRRGSYAAKIRQEYLDILEDIARACYYPIPYLMPQSYRTAEMIRRNYGQEPENGRLRRRDCHFFGQDSEKGDLLPKYRFFLKQDDYITQDLRTEKTRWLNGAFHMSDYDIASSWNLHKEFRAPDDYKRLCNFLKDYEPGKPWKKQTDIWDKLQTYQESVMKLKLKERHDAELRAIDERMSCIGELPEEFLTTTSRRSTRRVSSCTAAAFLLWIIVQTSFRSSSHSSRAL